MSSTLPIIHLRYLRKKAGLRQIDLARLLSITANLVSKYELRKLRPPIEILLACCLIFDCSMQELYPSLHQQIVQMTKHNAQALLAESLPKLTIKTEGRDVFLASLVTRI